MQKETTSNLDGILILDKPAGCTSFQMVKKIRGMTRVKKVGHGGTLDPFATGVLPILLGKATKFAGQFLSGEKGYLAEMILGIETDTLDIDGKIINQKTVKVNNEQLLEVFKKFLGKIKQVPPNYSAVHHNGKRLYEMARNGEPIEGLEPREVNIYKLDLLEISNEDFPKIIFEVWCSKGTYIRQLAADMAKELGTYAYLTALQRIYSRPFHISQALPLSAIEDLVKINQLGTVLIKKEDIEEIMKEDITW